jgi:DNA-binding transcriptional ArsR family regulator
MQTIRLQQVMQLLGDETRYRIFEVLLENRNLCVSEISHLLGVSASAVSQHFRMFELAGLVSKKRDGQRMCYKATLTSPEVIAVANLITMQRSKELIKI